MIGREEDSDPRFFLPITPLASLRRGRERDDLGTSQICEFNLLLVLSLAPRGFYPGTPVFPFSTKTNTPKVQFDLEFTDMFVRTPRKKSAKLCGARVFHSCDRSLSYR